MAKRPLALCALLLAWAPSASAEPRGFDEPSLPVVAGFGAIGAFAIGTHFFAPPPSEPSWTGTLALDDASRRLLRASSPEGRARAALASDLLLGSFVALPFADALTVSNGTQRARTALVDAEAFALTGALVISLKRTTARARPYTFDGPSTDRDRYESFPSGHTAFAFTGASLFCTQRWPRSGTTTSALACSSAFFGATAMGTLRIVADEHHLSDVLVGAAMGGLVGWIVPWLQMTEGSSTGMSNAPLAAEMPMAVVVGGSF